MAKVSVPSDAAAAADLLDAVAGGRLRTRLAATLPLTEAAEAHRGAQRPGLRGRLVLVA